MMVLLFVAAVVVAAVVYFVMNLLCDRNCPISVSVFLASVMPGTGSFISVFRAQYSP